MTWIPDLSRTAYHVHGPFVRAIGWLGKEHPFPTGAVPALFAQRLQELVGHAGGCEAAYGFGQFMGFHVCDLCAPEECRQGNMLKNRGLHNLAVPYAHLLFVFPELITHYMAAHHYRPPDQFIEAVQASPLPQTAEHAAVAEAFRHRLQEFARHRQAVNSARAQYWVAKAMCPRCGNWVYSYAAMPGDLRHCEVPVVNLTYRDEASPARVAIVVVEGIAAAGKTTVGRLLAARQAWDFFDADDFHPPSNVAKMGRGEPLTDADCAPWLDELRSVLSTCAVERRSVVLACVDLKDAHRRSLADGIDNVQFVYLRVDHAELPHRSAGPDEPFTRPRRDSQPGVIEEPTDTLVVDGDAPSETIVDTILEHLGLSVG